MTHSTQGFSLLEVNMALLLLVMGLGGILATYQSLAMQVQYTNQLQQALLVFEQMYQVLPLHADQLQWLQAQGGSSSFVPNGHDFCQQGGVCDSSTMVAVWWQHRQQLITQQLPSGELSITCDAVCKLGNKLHIQIRWHGPQSRRINCDVWHCITMEWPL